MVPFYVAFFARVFYHSNRSESRTRYLKANVLPGYTEAFSWQGVQAADPQTDLHGTFPFPQKHCGTLTWCQGLLSPEWLRKFSHCWCCCFPGLPLSWMPHLLHWPLLVTNEARDCRNPAPSVRVYHSQDTQRAPSPTSPTPLPICYHQVCAEV